MNEIKRQARFAGILYTLANLAAPFAIIYLPSLLIVPGDATATADHVRTSIGFVRIGIAAELINATVIVFAALAFYRLFKPVSSTHARTMLVLVLLAVPISLLNILNTVVALIFARRPDFLGAFDPQQLDAFVLLFLRLHGHGYVIEGIFWGLCLFTFCIIVMSCGFIQSLLGLFLSFEVVLFSVLSYSNLYIPTFIY